MTRSTLLALAVLAAVPLAARADPSIVLVHEGYVLGGDDQPVNVPTKITVKLWKDAANTQSANVLWTDSWNAVPIDQGRYSLLLGDTSQDGHVALPLKLFTGDVYLSVAFADGPDMTPRMRVGTVPTAGHAMTSDDVACAGCITPDKTAGLPILDPAQPQAGGLQLTGAVEAAKFVGDGSALTNLDPAQLNGKITESQINGAFVHLAGDESIAGTKTFSGSPAFAAADGTAPFAVASSTKVTNLNADTLDGLDSAAFAKATDMATVQARLASYLPLAGGSLTGGLVGTTAQFSGALSASSLSTAGAVNAASVTASGALSAGSISTAGALNAAAVTASGALNAGSISTAGAVNAGSLAASGALSAGATTLSGTLNGQSAIFNGSVGIGGAAPTDTRFFVTGLVRAQGYDIDLSQCPAPAERNGTNPDCYLAVSTNLPWLEAETYCERVFGGHLAVADSPTTATYLAGLRDRKIGTTSSVWIGITDMWSEGNWKTVTGSILPFSNFYPGEPNNSGGNENCGILYPASNNNQWNDAPCTTSYAFLCHRSMR